MVLISELNTTAARGRQGDVKGPSPVDDLKTWAVDGPENRRRIWAKWSKSNIGGSTPGSKEAAMLSALGYAGFGSDHLEDWRQFATGLVGLQAVERGNSLLAFRMDDRKQRIVIDRGIGA